MGIFSDLEAFKVLGCGESKKEAIRPDFNRTIMIDIQGAAIFSDVGFLLMREIDERFKIIAPMGDCLSEPEVLNSFETFVSPNDSSKDLPYRGRVRGL